MIEIIKKIQNANFFKILTSKQRGAGEGLNAPLSAAREQKNFETIYEAAAKIIDEEGAGAATPERVAAKSRFSVSRIRRHFPSKQAMLHAMALYGQHKIIEAVDAYLTGLEALAEPQKEDPKKIIRHIISFQLASMASGGLFRRNVIRLCWENEHAEGTVAAIRIISERVQVSIGRTQHPAFRVPTPATMFTLTRAIVGVARSASMEKTALLSGSALEDELVRLAWCLLAKKPYVSDE
jgi:AcrR family transcriptional regulator